MPLRSTAVVEADAKGLKGEASGDNCNVQSQSELIKHDIEEPEKR